MVSRMVGMKGFDLVQSVADGLVDRGIRAGHPGRRRGQYENFFSDLCGRHPGRVGTYIGFEPTLSQEIYAGADAFIMPSERACGLARWSPAVTARLPSSARPAVCATPSRLHPRRAMASPSRATAPTEAVRCLLPLGPLLQQEDWNKHIRYDMECDFSWDVSARAMRASTMRLQTSGKADQDSFSPRRVRFRTGRQGFLPFSKIVPKETLFLSQTGQNDK